MKYHGSVQIILAFIFELALNLKIMQYFLRIFRNLYKSGVKILELTLHFFIWSISLFLFSWLCTKYVGNGTRNVATLIFFFKVNAEDYRNNNSVYINQFPCIFSWLMLKLDAESAPDLPSNAFCFRALHHYMDSAMSIHRSRTRGRNIDEVLETPTSHCYAWMEVLTLYLHRVSESV